MDEKDIYNQKYRKKQLLERKRRIKRGEPTEKDIDLDCFFYDSFSSPRILTRQEVDELTGQ